MANKIVRNITEVQDVNKLAQHVTTQNDLIQTTDGSVYIVTKNGYEKITGGLSDSEIKALKNSVSDLEKAKDEQAKKVSELEKAKDEQDTKISDLEKAKDKQNTKISDLETSNTDLIERIEALEKPTDDNENEEPTE